MLKKKFAFTDSPLMDYIHRLIIEEQDEIGLAEALNPNKNLTKLFLDDVKFRMMNGKNYILSLYGFTGTGKSTVAQYFGHYTHTFVMSKYCKEFVEDIEKKFGRKPAFDVSNICFDTSELLNRIREGVPMETYIYDEAGTEKLVGVGSMREKMDKERIMKRVRMFQQNFIFCDPVEEDTKLSKLHLFKLQAFDIDKKNKLNRTVVHALNSYDDYSPYGHIITGFIELDDYIKKKYEKIKQLEGFIFGGGRLKLWKELAGQMVDKGILKFNYQDWQYMIDGWTNQNYTRDEVKSVVREIRFNFAKTKEEKKGDKIGID